MLQAVSASLRTLVKFLFHLYRRHPLLHPQCFNKISQLQVLSLHTVFICVHIFLSGLQLNLIYLDSKPNVLPTYNSDSSNSTLSSKKGGKSGKKRITKDDISLPTDFRSIFMIFIQEFFFFMIYSFKPSSACGLEPRKRI